MFGEPCTVRCRVIFGPGGATDCSQGWSEALRAEPLDQANDSSESSVAPKGRQLLTQEFLDREDAHYPLTDSTILGFVDSRKKLPEITIGRKSVLDKTI